MNIMDMVTHAILFICLALLVFLSLDSTASADCMSCLSHTGSGYTELACTGDSRFDVVRKCGEPDYSEMTGEIVTGKSESEKGRGSLSGGFAASKQTVEKLYYNCGQGRFVKVLVFVGGRLVSVQDGDRGSGQQKCW